MLKMIVLFSCLKYSCYIYTIKLINNLKQTTMNEKKIKQLKDFYIKVERTIENKKVKVFDLEETIEVLKKRIDWINASDKETEEVKKKEIRRTNRWIKENEIRVKILRELIREQSKIENELECCVN